MISQTRIGAWASSFIIALQLSACGGAATSVPAAATPVASAAAATTPVSEAPRANCPATPEVAADDYAAAVSHRESDPQAALSRFQIACAAGNACACTGLGLMHENGEGTSPSATESAAAYDRACELGDGWGCYDRAVQHTHATPEETDLSSPLFARGCEQGCARSCVEVGRRAASGIGRNMDPRAAVAMYERACAADDTFGCYFLAQALFRGVGVDQDIERADRLAASTCEAGFAYSCTELATIRAQRTDEVATLLQRACEGGDPMACDARATHAVNASSVEAALDLAPNATRRRVSISSGDSSTTEVRAGGPVDMTTIGVRPACIGHVAREPSLIVDAARALQSLTFSTYASFDTTVVVRDPSGDFFCADDEAGGVYGGRVELAAPEAGTYRVWVGAFETPYSANVTVDAR